jgi:hypothetical protein
MTRSLSMLVVLCSVVMGVVLGGCKAGPGQYDLTVTLADSLKRPNGALPPVQVDVIGIKAADMAQWQGYSVSKYFSGDDARRKDAAARGMKEMALGPAKPSDTLSKGDQLWGKWQKAEMIVILANIPGYSGSTGGDDARRLILPTRTDFWKDSKININVESSLLSIDASTPRQTPKED